MKKSDLDPKYLARTEFADPAAITTRQSIYSYGLPKKNLHDWILDHQRWSGNEMVADIGCGNCTYLPSLASGRARDIVGIDLSLAFARLADQYAHGVVADANRLPLRSESFDVVLALFMLYHSPDPAAILSECYRILRPGGVVLATTYAKNHLGLLDSLIAEAWNTTDNQAPGAPSLTERWHATFSPQQAFELIVARGFATSRDSYSNDLRIPSPQPVLRYVDTLQASLQFNCHFNWEEFMARLEAILGEIIETSGSITLRSEVDLLIGTRRQ